MITLEPFVHCPSVPQVALSSITLDTELEMAFKTTYRGPPHKIEELARPMSTPNVPGWVGDKNVQYDGHQMAKTYVAHCSTQNRCIEDLKETEDLMRIDAFESFG